MVQEVNSKLVELRGILEPRKKETNFENNLAKQLDKLTEERQELKVEDVASLRSDAQMYDRLADFADKIADTKEKGNYPQKLDSEDQEEIKEVLMGALGIPAEFVDLLGLAAKGGPEALRETAELFRQEAKEKLIEADFLSSEIYAIEQKISSLKSAMSSHSHENKSEQAFLRKLTDLGHLEKHWRNRAEDEYRELLMKAEGFSS